MPEGVGLSVVMQAARCSDDCHMQQRRPEILLHISFKTWQLSGKWRTTSCMTTDLRRWLL